jgi:murein L,D-transpeptidase YcbB/YkuD
MSDNKSFEDYGTEFRQILKMDLFENKYDEIPLTFIDHLTVNFYSSRHFVPLWTINFETNQQYQELIKLLKSADNYGLVTEAYSVHLLDSLKTQMLKTENSRQKNELRIKFEKIATQSAFQMMINLAVGINPSDSLLAVYDYANELPVYLNYICQKSKIKEGMLALQPQSQQFKSLQIALEGYLKVVNIDTFHYSIKLLEQSDSLVLQSLIKQGYIDQDSLKNIKSIETSLNRFQRTHSLKQTGRKDKSTLEMLSKSTKDIFYLMALNLDRLRKDNLTDKNCIIVNIPEFKLFYFDIKGQINIYNVVVGKRLTPTPLLSSSVDRIIANPCWNVPRSITMNEIIPKLQADSTYLSKHDFALIDDKANPVDASKINWNTVDEHQFNYYFRQQNCENNALGSMKFLFPNQYSVYIHDTPSKKLFNEDFRAFSHGCIRIQYPEKLATQLVADNNSKGETIDIIKILRSKEPYEIKLSEKIPISINYYTCTADSLGEVNFHPDIYAMDDLAIQKLFVKNYR